MSQKNFFFLIIISLGGLFLFPQFSLAGGTYTVCAPDSSCPVRVPVCYEGLVPCGSVINIYNPATGAGYENGRCVGAMWPIQYEQNPDLVRCQLCHFFVMLDGIFDFVIFTLVPIVAVLMLVIGGLMFIAHQFGGAELLPGGTRGGPAFLNQAKKLITSVVIGLIIIFASWVIISAFFAIIGVANWTGLQQGWFTINCPIVWTP